MSIKKILISFIFLVVITNTYGQSRSNNKMIELGSKSEKLKKATGWEYNNESGKWIENKNVIYDSKRSSYWKSHVSQNFKWIQFSSIVFENEKYYVFLFEKLSGSYKYPSISHEWRSENQTHFFIIDSSDYKNLKKQIDLKSGKDIKITSNKMNGNITDRFKILKGEHLYNEENLIAKINTTLAKEYNSSACFTFNSQVVDGVDVVRFRLPLEGGYGCEKDLENAYFEVETSDFKTILID